MDFVEIMKQNFENKHQLFIFNINTNHHRSQALTEQQFLYFTDRTSNPKIVNLALVSRIR